MFHFKFPEIRQYLEWGFGSDDYWQAKNWKDLVGLEVTKQWLALGWDSSYQQAYYWQQTNSNTITREELESLEEQGIPAQGWVDLFYPKTLFV